MYQGTTYFIVECSTMPAKELPLHFACFQISLSQVSFGLTNPRIISYILEEGESIVYTHYFVYLNGIFVSLRDAISTFSGLVSHQILLSRVCQDSTIRRHNIEYAAGRHKLCSQRTMQDIVFSSSFQQYLAIIILESYYQRVNRGVILL